MKIYNTLTKRKEELIPSKNNIFKIYVCGPTVYDHSHLGHFKTFIFFDILVRYLRFKGYNVKYVMNITDVDDKIITRANEVGKTIKEYTKQYIDSFLEDIDSLGLVKPDVMPKATEHIDEMIRIIKKLMAKGFAYSSDGNIYYDIEKFSGYGKLSKVALEEMRGQEEPGKRNPLDFALWKAWKPGEPYWDSPWGRGRPGWHIECSAMAMKYLGETIDIHGGGSDLIFPHHENEIAQSEATTDKKFVRYWVHVGTLEFKKEKMSKSLGNVILIKDILRKYPADVIRLYYFSIYYRKPQEISIDALNQMLKLYERIRNTYISLEEEYKRASENPDNRVEDIIDKYIDNFIKALDDDMNTPKALSIFSKFIRWINKYFLSKKPDKRSLAKALYFYEMFRRISGIMEKEKISVADEIRDIIDILIKVRKELRRRKLYDLADVIREELRNRGIMLEDIGLETRIKFIK